jgi:hypothetical protein
MFNLQTHFRSRKTITSMRNTENQTRQKFECNRAHRLTNSRKSRYCLFLVLMAVQLRELVMSPVHVPRLLRTSTSYPNTRRFNVDRRNTNIEDQNESIIHPGKRHVKFDDKDSQENFTFESFSPSIAEQHPVLRLTKLKGREFNTEFDQYAVPKLSRCVEMN